MKKHLLLTCMAYLYFGFGMAVQQLGIKAGWKLELVLGIIISSLVFFVIVAFTSMEKVKEILFHHDKKQEEITFDFEKEIKN